MPIGLVIDWSWLKLALQVGSARSNQPAIDYDRRHSSNWTCSLWFLVAMTILVIIVPNVFMNCGPPPSISNGFMEPPTSTKIRGSVTYICDNGYEINPGVKTAIASCMISLNWKHVPTCLAVECGPPPSISNGSPGTPTKTTFEGTVTYTCNSGYRTTMATVSCLDTWNWETAPTCLAVNCGIPPSISNGSPGTPINTTFGGTVTYICNSGYRTSLGTPMATVSCLTTGNWETIPTCLEDTEDTEDTYPIAILVIIAIPGVFKIVRRVCSKKYIPAAPCGDNGHKGG